MKLESLIGLSRIECESCLQSDRLDAIAAGIDTIKSETGIFIDEISGFQLRIADSVSHCGVGSVWEKMDRARKNAVTMLTTDIFMGLSKRAKARNEPYRGTVGSTSSSRINQMPVSGSNSLKINTLNLPGVVWAISKVQVMLQTDQTIHFEIWKTGKINGKLEDQASKLKEFDFAAGTGKYYSTTANPISLPVDGSEYEFRYTGSGLYKENKLSCGCSSKDVYLSQYIKESLQTGGFGIVLESAITCKSEEIIALNAEDKPAIKLSTGFALQYKSGELMIADIINNPEINRYTMLPQAQLSALHTYCMKKYEENLSYITQEIDISKNACFDCGGSGSWSMAGIVATGNRSDRVNNSSLY